MISDNDIREHDRAVNTIFKALNDLGFEAHKEMGGLGWRADVFACNGEKKIAFEVQLSNQSLNKTWERQNRYLKDGIIGCWLVLHRFKKLKNEHVDLPLFYIDIHNGEYFVSLVDDRKQVPLLDFVSAFMSGGIKFSTQARTSSVQDIKICFFEMECWKCGSLNHVYYVESPYITKCNIPLEEEECLWSDEKLIFKPEVISAVSQILKGPEGTNLKMGAIKQRISKTVGHSYLSFGCYKCDSIFGDMFVTNNMIDVRSEGLPVIRVSTKVASHSQIIRNFQHWCFPENSEFCD